MTLSQSCGTPLQNTDTSIIIQNSNEVAMKRIFWLGSPQHDELTILEGGALGTLRTTVVDEDA